MDNCFFGNKYKSNSERINSYDFLEMFLSTQYSVLSGSPDTEKCVSELLKVIKNFSNSEFAFLICHSGYIPESYAPDSSQETLFTKFVETLVMEWAIRIGFDESVLPTQKSSKEDVTLMDDSNVIVCDAKSFRLGRSQGAPNVKDVLKHADISKWLSAYPEKNRVGGLVTFPSQHDWKRGSDFYQYTTDKSLPTLCLNYEHMAFILLSGLDKNILIDALNNYGNIFPSKFSKIENNRDAYYSTIERNLFGLVYEDWLEFKCYADRVVSERVYHCLNRLEYHVRKIKEEIESKYSTESDVEKLRAMVIASEYLNKTEDFHKQIDRISKFRSSSNNYYEED
ncbi:HindIII family type II restriction endonuclease [Dickeya zeae]|uniref:HindIII family type II restriction endonuclease n=1 Tax=Dickeya zeae TaxID=204042 RepID=A0ABX8W0G3_9GAMM|nr:HindIII family type II restriction endonuclease [Dickeya zeae]QYM93332.1 HindIII family type II restriction endonuclease [Dickeya zeae]